MNVTTSQDQRDRANEWTAEHHPDLEGGPEFDAAYTAALGDIVEIDAAADAVDLADGEPICPCGFRLSQCARRRACRAGA